MPRPKLVARAAGFLGEIFNGNWTPFQGAGKDLLRGFGHNVRMGNGTKSRLSS
jgi:hypothetical protein